MFHVIGPIISGGAPVSSHSKLQYKKQKNFKSPTGFGKDYVYYLREEKRLT